jgi:hypothetical protein
MQKTPTELAAYRTGTVQPGRNSSPPKIRRVSESGLHYWKSEIGQSFSMTSNSSLSGFNVKSLTMYVSPLANTKNLT